MWSYQSGNGQTTSVATGFSQANANLYGGPGYASATAVGTERRHRDHYASILHSQRDNGGRPKSAA